MGIEESEVRRLRDQELERERERKRQGWLRGNGGNGDFAPEMTPFAPENMPFAPEIRPHSPIRVLATGECIPIPPLGECPGKGMTSLSGYRDPSNSLLIETAALRGRCGQYAGVPRARTPGPPSVRVVARQTPCHTVVPVAVWVPSNTRFWLPTLRARRRQQRSPRTRMGLRSPKSTP